MTLIYTKTGDTEMRRCDSKCYDAKHADCDCICGGENHGVGFEVAKGNVVRRFGPVAEQLFDVGGVQI